MSVIKYDEYRQQIKDGDLLIWSSDKSSFISKIYLYLIRLLTLSNYAHVGVALWSNGRLLVVEATIPKVRIIPISLANDFYHIPMHLNVTENNIRYLMSTIGEKYSILKAIKSYFDIPIKEDGTWQCAELARSFYKNANLELPEEYTPTDFIDNILDDTKKHIVKVQV